MRQGGHQLGEGNLNDWLQKAVKAAKIAVDPERQRCVAHTLRSHAETELAKRSGDFVPVCVAIGHKLPGVSGRYNYLAKHPADHRAALYPEEGAPRRKGLAVVA